MSTALRNRVRKLEAVQRHDAPVVVSVLDITGGPLASIAYSGQVWTREPAEPEANFRARVLSIRHQPPAVGNVIALIERGANRLSPNQWTNPRSATA